MSLLSQDFSENSAVSLALNKLVHAVSSWTVKRRLSVIGGLVLGSLVVSVAAYETENLIEEYAVAQIAIPNQMISLTEEYGNKIDLAHSRMLNYLYTGDAINGKISRQSFADATMSFRQLEHIDQDHARKYHAFLTKISDRSTAFEAQLTLAVNDMKTSRPMSEEVLGSIVDLNMVKQALVNVELQFRTFLRNDAAIMSQKYDEALMVARIFFAIVIVLGIVLVMSSVYCISFSIVHPLESITKAMGNMGRGDYNFSLSHLLQGGEIGQLIHGTEKAKSDGKKNHIVFQMTEQMPHALMMADRHTLKIDYLNQSALDLFSDIEAFLPCPADEILGRNIDMFHQHPQHQRKMMSNKDAFPFASSFQIGGHHIKFSAVAIDDSHGDWSHIMVCWEDATKQESFQESLHVKVQELTSKAENCSASIDDIAHAAHVSSQVAATVSSSAKESAQSVARVSEGASQLALSFDHVVHKLTETKTIADQASMEVSSAQFSFMELEAAGEEIVHVVSSIEKIAANIRTLSMNATIEAARAGEYGAGFSVVAMEVRKLAQEAAAATLSAKTSVESLTNNLNDTSTSFRQVGDAMEQLDSIATELESMAGEQSGSTGEIAVSAVNASGNVKDITFEIQRVFEQTKETNALVEKIKSSTLAMQQESDALSDQVHKFVHNM